VWPVIEPEPVSFSVVVSVSDSVSDSVLIRSAPVCSAAAAGHSTGYALQARAVPHERERGAGCAHLAGEALEQRLGALLLAHVLAVVLVLVAGRQPRSQPGLAVLRLDGLSSALQHRGGGAAELDGGRLGIALRRRLRRAAFDMQRARGRFPRVDFRRVDWLV